MRAWRPDYLSEANPETLIVYGLAKDAGRVLANLFEEPGGAAPLSERHALFAAATPGFRLSSPGWIDIGPDQRMRLASTENYYLLCREQIVHGASHFAVAIRGFLDSYLDFCRDQVVAHRAELDPDPADEDLYSHEDWVFSAWLPMPHARILLPASFGEDGPVFAEVDVAFWDGKRLIAVMLDGGTTPLKSVRRRQDHLFETHPAIELVRVPKGGAFPAAAFPGTVTRFWEGLAFPVGPCPPRIVWPSD